MCPHLSETQNCDPEPCYTWDVKREKCIPQQPPCGVGIATQTVYCLNRNMVRKFTLKVIFYYYIILENSLLAPLLTFVGQVHLGNYFKKKMILKMLYKSESFINCLQNEYLFCNYMYF